jgi:Spy/CpxP family protein refolding chaperone
MKERNKAGRIDRRTISLMLPALVLVFVTSSLWAQEGASKAKAEGSGCPCAKGSERCLDTMKKKLDLTEEQHTQMKGIQKESREETAQLKDRIRSKKQAIGDLFRNPDAKDDEIIAAHKEMNLLKAEMKDKALKYGLRARSVLTPEQIRELPQGCYLGIRGWGGKCSCGHGKGKEGHKCCGVSP